ncbi:PhoH family protein [Thermincola ferriacetica]|uniref:PhoH-like protein n=2 Tax=Thermincola TaxID=278993 RepID=D5XAQ8_THEPJ|nr:MULTISPECIES: PhoH family protein [Thermincola]ADG83262.1 PhoH family protein [Thermincola potens JR]KNZ68340.1 PhoH family protein [Thermincola ferriacetica]
MITKVEKKISIDDVTDARNIFGHHDENIRFLEETLNVAVVLRENQIVFSGDEEAVEQAAQVFLEMVALSNAGQNLTTREIQYIIGLVKSGQGRKMQELASELIIVTFRGKPLQPKTHGQKQYIDAIKQHDVVFGVGPAGTGKTYLAVAMAAKALKEKAVNRLIITRPAVEAGEKLGFLPGDLQEKVNPYLRPLYDSLFDIIGPDKTNKFLEKGIIEVAPLAYMRGRTLDDAFLILDEAQNTTPEQMKMFLTRLGFGSKAVITGDITQIDLPKGQRSGLLEAERILKDVKGIAFRYFGTQDVMRHQLVQRIIQAYDRAAEQGD